MPYQNSAATIGESIGSILRQGFTSWELIAVNDHSSDESEEIVKDFADKDSRIKPIRSFDRGIANALNRGIESSSAHLIARMDADDLMLPDRLIAQVDHLLRNPSLGLVSCKVRHWPCGDHDSRGYENYVEWTNRQLSHEQISLGSFIESPLAHPSVIFRRELILKYGLYENGPFPEDYELWLRFLANGVKMEKLDQTLLKWRDLPTRLSRKSTNYSKDAFQKIKAKYLSKWIKSNLMEEIEIRGWGAGRIALTQAKHLWAHGLRLEIFYDVDKKKFGKPRNGLTVKSVDEIPPPGKVFLLVLAGARSARPKIRSFLQARKYLEGRDYLFVA